MGSCASHDAKAAPQAPSPGTWAAAKGAVKSAAKDPTPPASSGNSSPAGAPQREELTDAEAAAEPAPAPAAEAAQPAAEAEEQSPAEASPRWGASAVALPVSPVAEEAEKEEHPPVEPEKEKQVPMEAQKEEHDVVDAAKEEHPPVEAEKEEQTPVEAEKEETPAEAGEEVSPRGAAAAHTLPGDELSPRAAEKEEQPPVESEEGQPQVEAEREQPPQDVEEDRAPVEAEKDEPSPAEVEEEQPPVEAEKEEQPPAEAERQEEGPATEEEGAGGALFEPAAGAAAEAPAPSRPHAYAAAAAAAAEEEDAEPAAPQNVAVAARRVGERGRMLHVVTFEYGGRAMEAARYYTDFAVLRKSCTELSGVKASFPKKTLGACTGRKLEERTQGLDAWTKAAVTAHWPCSGRWNQQQFATFLGIDAGFDHAAVLDPAASGVLDQSTTF